MRLSSRFSISPDTFLIIEPILFGITAIPRIRTYIRVMPWEIRALLSSFPVKTCVKVTEKSVYGDRCFGELADDLFNPFLYFCKDPHDSRPEVRTWREEFPDCPRRKARWSCTASSFLDIQPFRRLCILAYGNRRYGEMDRSSLFLFLLRILEYIFCHSLFLHHLR